MFHKECHGGKLKRDKDISEMHSTALWGRIRVGKNVPVIKLSCTRCKECVRMANTPKTIKEIITTTFDREKRKITNYTYGLQKRKRGYHQSKINIYVVQKEIETTEEPEVQSEIPKDPGKTEEKSEEIYCPYCGEPLVTTGSYCPNCGTKLEERIKEIKEASGKQII